MRALVEEPDVMPSALSNGLTKIALYFIAQCGIVLRAVAQQTVEEEQIEEVDLLCVTPMSVKGLTSSNRISI